MSLRRPRPLVPGDQVRVISPSFGSLGRPGNRRRADRARRALEQLGLEVSEGSNARLSDGHIAGTAAERADDINSAFADPDVAGIICAVGGANCGEVLHHIDFDLVAANPKVLTGHSDNVLILLALHQETGLVTFHGPSYLMQWGEYPEPYAETIEWFRQACMSDAPLHLTSASSRTHDVVDWGGELRNTKPRQRDDFRRWSWLQHGHTRGPLVGGSLDSLIRILHTPWMPCVDGAVLFTDAQWFTAPHLDGALAVLAEHQILQSIGGLVVGVPRGFIDLSGAASHHDVISKWAHLVDGPVLVDADCGHCDPAWTLPIGEECVLDAGLGQVMIHRGHSCRAIA